MAEIACPLCVGILDDECTECFGRGVVSVSKSVTVDHRESDFYGVDLPGEEWLPIPNHERYYISSAGRVRNNETGRLIRANYNNYGRLVIKFGSFRSGWALHRIVAQVFLKDFDSKRQVIFIDGDPSNCAVENLKQTERIVRGKANKAA